jgi:hypothetical protein
MDAPSRPLLLCVSASPASRLPPVDGASDEPVDDGSQWQMLSRSPVACHALDYRCSPICLVGSVRSDVLAGRPQTNEWASAWSLGVVRRLQPMSTRFSSSWPFPVSSPCTASNRSPKTSDIRQHSSFLTMARCRSARLNRLGTGLSETSHVAAYQPEFRATCASAR